MGKIQKIRELYVYLNGIRVGRWSIARSGAHEFSYEDSWLDHTEARPISLSMPLVASNFSYRGDMVLSFFDNLLPESSDTRQRIRSRYGAASLSPFDLLAEIGRDCVGAIQILQAGQEGLAVGSIKGRTVDDNELADILKGLSSRSALASYTADEFRISLAGVQEKTALLQHEGRWMIPHGATPSTHILKLPLGRIGGSAFDMSGSVENEWLCLKIAKALGLDVASSEMLKIADQTVLVVERFDRRMSKDRKRILRLPQEDFCQVTGCPPDRKYESDGGPGILDIMRILLGSQNSNADRESFFTAQILFWLLAAPDGHAKNYSVFIERAGRFRLSPFYDIMSAYPIMGHGSGLLAAEKLKMAMAFTGKNRHYFWRKVGIRHMRETASLCGMDAALDRIVEKLIRNIPGVISELSDKPPKGFPDSVATPIFNGLEKQAALLGDSL